MQKRLASTVAVFVIAGAFGSIGCEQARAAPAPKPNADELPAARATDRAAHYAKLTPWLARRDELPRKVSEKRSADEVIRRDAPADADRTLLLRVEDARFEKKSVLPLRLTRTVSSLDLGGLEAAVTRNEAGNLDAESAGRIDWLTGRRYVGVFHVIDYAAPRWIHRVNRTKAEWVAGFLNVWLVVHDAKSGDALCSTHLHVKNDTTDAPLQRRLRSETAERLSGELGTALKLRTREALARISSALRIEDDPDKR